MNSPLNEPSFFCIRLWILLFIGFANALPIPMSGSLLSIWLTEAGFDKRTIGLYALTALPFALKPLWFMPVHFLTPHCLAAAPRKTWVSFALIGMSTSFAIMSAIEPHQHPYLLAAALCGLTFFAGCLYVSGLSYEIESLHESEYGLGSAYVVSGYRIGLLVAGAGALYLAYLFDWPVTFRFLAFPLFLGVFVIWKTPEPYQSKETIEEKKKLFANYPSLVHGFFQEMIVAPLQTLSQRSDWKLLIALLLSFKIGDQMAKSMTGPFFLFLVFSKADLALATKLWGFIATIAGAMTFAYCFKGKHPFFACAQTSLLHSLTLIGYYTLAVMGKSFYLLYSTLAIENFTAGMAMTSFISLLWKICDKRYSAMQYALLWSLFSLKSELFTCFGALIASWCGWHFFFLSLFLGSLLSSGIVYRWIARAFPEAATQPPNLRSEPCAR